MARLTLARKIAAITLIVWKKEVRFDANYLKLQAALAPLAESLSIFGNHFPAVTVGLFLYRFRDLPGADSPMDPPCGDRLLRFEFGFLEENRFGVFISAEI